MRQSTFLALLLNHLLAQQPGATARLLPHAGKRIRLSLPGLTADFLIDPEGQFQGSDPDVADLHLELRPGALRAGFGGTDPRRLLAISGPADLAQAVGECLQNLRWDAAADLAPWMGDALAERCVEGVRQAGAEVARGAWASAQMLGDFLADERRLLLRPQQLQEWRVELADLRDRLERLDKRVSRAEGLNRSAPAQRDAVAPS